jgi:hypothetical protein
MNAYLMAKMSRFIKYNKNLLHLDLSQTGLDELTLRTIGVSLRRARSLLSLHLSGNPGINESLKSFLFTRLHCADISSFFDHPSDENFPN